MTKQRKGFLARMATTVAAWVRPDTDPIPEQFDRKRRKQSKRTAPKPRRRTPPGQRHHRRSVRIGTVAALKAKAEDKRERRRARNLRLAAGGGFGLESFWRVVGHDPDGRFKS